MEAMRQDQILTGFLTIYEMDEDSVFEVRLVGTRDAFRKSFSPGHTAEPGAAKRCRALPHATMEPKVLLNPKRWEKLLIFWDISMIRPGFRKGINSG